LIVDAVKEMATTGSTSLLLKLGEEELRFI